MFYKTIYLKPNCKGVRYCDEIEVIDKLFIEYVVLLKSYEMCSTGADLWCADEIEVEILII